MLMLYAGFIYIYWFCTGFSPVQVAAGSEPNPAVGSRKYGEKGLPQCSLTEAKPQYVQYRQLHSPM